MLHIGSPINVVLNGTGGSSIYFDDRRPTTYIAVLNIASHSRTLLIQYSTKTIFVKSV